MPAGRDSFLALPWSSGGGRPRQRFATPAHLAKRTLASDSSRSARVAVRAYLELILGTFAPRYRPEDMYTGNLAGALECLDSGITTVQDFSHLQYSVAHSEAAITALRESGIRAVFGHGYPISDPAARRPD